MAILCFCPTDNIAPFSPIWVSNTLGNLSTNSLIPNCLDKSNTN